MKTKKEVFESCKYKPIDIIPISIRTNLKQTKPMEDYEIFIWHFMSKITQPHSQDTCREVLKSQFTGGYCWYFANILKALYPDKGTICVVAPLSHIVWVCDGIPYDCNGMYIEELGCHYIPEWFCNMFMEYTGKDPMLGFKHITINNHQPDDKFVGREDWKEFMMDWCEFCGIEYNPSVEEYY